jgi:hypothetical protein
VLLHTVLVRPHAHVTEADFRDLAHMTERIAERLCGAGNYDIGANSTREPLDQGYAFGFMLRFVDRDELATYLAVKEDDLLSRRIRELAEKVRVFDLEA